MDDNEQCSICMETLNDQVVTAHPAIEDQMAHRFHKACLAQHVYSERGGNYYQCPLCRTRCPEDVIRPIKREFYPNCCVCNQPLEESVVDSPHNNTGENNSCHHEAHVECWQDVVTDGSGHCPVCNDDVSNMTYDDIDVPADVESNLMDMVYTIHRIFMRVQPATQLHECHHVLHRNIANHMLHPNRDRLVEEMSYFLEELDNAVERSLRQ